MKPTIRILFFILILVSLAACTPMPVPTATSTATFIPSATLTATPVPTSTATPSPTPTPEPDPMEAIEATMMGFLNAAGEYSDEELASIWLLHPDSGNRFTGQNANIENDLGAVYEFPGHAFVQGILIGSYILKEDDGERLIILFGTKNPARERVVYLIQVDESTYSMIRGSNNSFLSSRIAQLIRTSHDAADDLYATSMEEQQQIFEERWGEIMMIHLELETNLTVEYLDGIHSMVLGDGGSEEDYQALVERIIKKRTLQKELYPFLFKVDKNTRAGDNFNPCPIAIDSIADLSDGSINWSELPFFGWFVFKK